MEIQWVTVGIIQWILYAYHENNRLSCSRSFQNWSGHANPKVTAEYHIYMNTKIKEEKGKKQKSLNGKSLSFVRPLHF